MIFINTRPASRASVLTTALKDKGLEVLELPLLELTELSISEREEGYLHRFITTTDYSALVVVSPSAARLGLSSCPQGFVPQCAIIAVGQATATVLRDAGWRVICPEEASNEGMMCLPELSTLTDNQNVLIWRGRGGRRLLVNHLQDNGVCVDAIAWYQRRCPPHLKDNFAAIAPRLRAKADKQDSHRCDAKIMVLISSGEAFSNWRGLINDLQNDSLPYALEDFCYLTFGQRLSDRLTGLALDHSRIDSLFIEDVWQGALTFDSHL